MMPVADVDPRRRRPAPTSSSSPTAIPHIVTALASSALSAKPVRGCRPVNEKRERGTPRGWIPLETLSQALASKRAELDRHMLVLDGACIASLGDMSKLTGYLRHPERHRELRIELDTISDRSSASCPPYLPKRRAPGGPWSGTVASSSEACPGWSSRAAPLRAAEPRLRPETWFDPFGRTVP